jgi:hypothetical protein
MRADAIQAAKTKLVHTEHEMRQVLAIVWQECLMQHARKQECDLSRLACGLCARSDYATVSASSFVFWAST